MKKFIQGSSILIIGDLLTKIISILYVIPLARIDEGVIVLMTNLLIPFGFFVVFSTLGINLIMSNELVRATSDDERKGVLLNVGLIIGVCTILGMLIMFMFSPLIMKSVESNSRYIPHLISGARWLTLGILLFSITSYLRSIFIAYGGYKIVSFTFISEQLVKVGIILIGAYVSIVVLEKSTVSIVNIIVISILLSMLSTLVAYLYYFFKNGYQELFIRGSFKFESKKIKFLLMSALVLFIGGIYITFFDFIDLIFLNNQLLNLEASNLDIDIIKNEYFVYSFKVVMVPISISAAFIQVMIKQIGESENKSREINKIIFIVSLYSILAIYFLMLTGNNVHDLLFGENKINDEFVKLKNLGLIAVQSLIIPVYITKNVIGGYIITNNGKPSSIMYSTGAIIVLKIVLDFILFQVFSIYGYIFASVISLLIGIAILIVMNKELFTRVPENLIGNAWLYIKALIMVGVTVFVFSFIKLPFGNFVQIIVKSIFILFIFSLVYYNNIKILLKLN